MKRFCNELPFLQRELMNWKLQKFYLVNVNDQFFNLIAFRYSP